MQYSCMIVPEEKLQWNQSEILPRCQLYNVIIINFVMLHPDVLGKLASPVMIMMNLLTIIILRGGFINTTIHGGGFISTTTHSGGFISTIARSGGFIAHRYW